MKTSQRFHLSWNLFVLLSFLDLDAIIKNVKTDTGKIQDLLSLLQKESHSLQQQVALLRYFALKSQENTSLQEVVLFSLVSKELAAIHKKVNKFENAVARRKLENDLKLDYLYYLRTQPQQIGIPKDLQKIVASTKRKQLKRKRLPQRLQEHLSLILDRQKILNE